MVVSSMCGAVIRGWERVREEQLCQLALPEGNDGWLSDVSIPLWIL